MVENITLYRIKIKDEVLKTMIFQIGKNMK